MISTAAGCASTDSSGFDGEASTCSVLIVAEARRRFQQRERDPCAVRAWVAAEPADPATDDDDVPAGAPGIEAAKSRAQETEVQVSWSPIFRCVDSSPAAHSRMPTSVRRASACTCRPVPQDAPGQDGPGRGRVPARRPRPRTSDRRGRGASSRCADATIDPGCAFARRAAASRRRRRRRRLRRGRDGQPPTPKWITEPDVAAPARPCGHANSR